MKKRTRVVAWIMLVYSAWFSVFLLLWALPYTHLLPHFVPSSMPSGMLQNILPVCIQVPLWIFLLKRRTWAWWGLTIIYCGLALFTLYWVACTPSYWLARGRTAIIPIVLMTILNLLLRSIFVLPLFFLLTDRPRGWDAMHEALSTKH